MSKDKQPLYRKIENDLKSQISDGTLKAGQKVPSVNDLVERYGISNITAVRTLKELKSSGCVVYKRGKGYFVSEGREESAPEINGVIACCLRSYRKTSLVDNFFNNINCGVEEQCCLNHMHMLRFHSACALTTHVVSNDGIGVIKRSILSKSKEVDGLLLDCRIPDFVIEELLEKTSKPMVLVGRSTALPIDAVGPDKRTGILKGREHALALGYSNFIFCTSNFKTGLGESTGVMGTFNEFVKSNRIVPEDIDYITDCNIVPPEETCAEVKAVYERKARSGKTLFVCESDYIAVLIKDFFNTQSVALGESVGILGHDAYEMAVWGNPRISTVGVKPVEIGRMAVDLLISYIGGKRRQRNVYHCPESVFLAGETL